jgi:hypothetical protein
MDYYVETPEGLGRYFDGLKTGTNQLWEVKTGYYSNFLSNSTPLFSTKRQMGITASITYQALDQVAISKRCGYSLLWSFDNQEVASFVRQSFEGNIAYPQDVRYIR